MPDNQRSTANASWTPDVDRRNPYEPKYVPLWNNVITIGGILVVAVAVLAMSTFTLFTVVSPVTNPYVDIVGYLIVPTVMIAGLVTIPLGILFKSWRLRRRDAAQHLIFRFPRIDLNDAKQRRVAKIVLTVMFVLLPVVAVSSYHGYHYTDSADFCSKACHVVMEPQAVAYESSPHARVSCAECHIGTGASWFVKAKLSGTRQVLAVLRDSYRRPIPPAIHHLRPARETCERCHWPKKFFGAQLKEIVHFAPDEANTRTEIDMLLKTGGGDESVGRAEGIHLHMTLSGSVEYIATDDLLQDIPWVRWTDPTGNELIYRSDGLPSSDPKPEGQIRTLDCMDCHNRPAHKFRSPDDSLDLYLEGGKIDTTLPYIKREALAALIEPYPDVATAENRIGSELAEFYQTNYPEIWSKRRASVNLAIDVVRDIYRSSFFPAMKVDWLTYPDNIGHKITAGCFRCHDGGHVDQNGVSLSNKCNTCHTFLNPMRLNGETQVISEGEFIHPMPLEGKHSQIRCNACHGGRTTPVADCAGCHTTQAGFRAGVLPEFAAFDIPASPMAEAVDCEGCHDLSEPTNIETIDAMCMDCHDDEDRFDGMLASWKEASDRLMEMAEKRVDDDDRYLLELLRDAVPLHNFEAAKRILDRIAPQSADMDAP